MRSFCMKLTFVLRSKIFYSAMSCFLFYASHTQALSSKPVGSAGLLNSAHKASNQSPNSENSHANNKSKENPVETIGSILTNLSYAGLNSPAIHFVYLVPSKHKETLANDLISQDSTGKINKKMVKSNGKDKAVLLFKQLTVDCTRASSPAVGSKTLVTVQCQAQAIKKSRQSSSYNPAEMIGSVFEQLQDSRLYNYAITFDLPVRKSTSSLLKEFSSYQKKLGFSAKGLSVKNSKTTSLVNIHLAQDSAVVSCYRVPGLSKKISKNSQAIKCSIAQSLYIKDARLW